MQVNPSDPRIPLADQAVIDIKAQHNWELHNGEENWHWINLGRLGVEERHAARELEVITKLGQVPGRVELSGYGRCTEESSIETPFLNPCDLEEHRFILLSGEIESRHHRTTSRASRRKFHEFK
jgi:hypothetical protein